MKKTAATDAVAAPSNHTLKEEKMDPQKLVEHFSMSPHPEGGFFAETYRSQGAIPADALPGFGGTRNFSTGILFILRRGEYSHLHRLKQDEMWHFYLGAPLRLAIVTASTSNTPSQAAVGSALLRRKVPILRLWAVPWLRDLILRILKWPIPTFWGRPSPTPPGWYVNSVRVIGR